MGNPSPDNQKEGNFSPLKKRGILRNIHPCTEVNSDMAAVMMSGLLSLPCSAPRNRFYIVSRSCIASLRMMDVLVVFVANLSVSW